MSDKKDYEAAVNTFQEADRAYKDAEGAFFEGMFLTEIYAVSKGDMVRARYEWGQLQERLRELLNTRNSALKAAKDVLRPAVQLAPTQERGVDGKASVVTAGPFSVTSVTSRGFDAKSLMDRCRDEGVLEELMEQEKLNKDGVRERLVQQTWDIDFAGVTSWLKSINLESIVLSSYDEREKTPAVKGPKELAFFGDKKE